MEVQIREEDAKRQFRTAEVLFGRSSRAHPEHVYTSYYRFGRQPARLRVVGKKLAAHVSLPFSHLRMDERTDEWPQLAIDLWDESETGIHRSSDSVIGGPGWYTYTEISSSGRFLTQRLPNTCVCFDRMQQRIVGSIAWGERIFTYEKAKPLARLLVQWYNDRGVHVVHSGLVSLQRQGVVLAGRSGSGKSTVALACLLAGFEFLSEDFTGLEQQEDGTFLGHSLYNSVFLSRDHSRWFPDLAPHAVNSGPSCEQKCAFLLAELFPERLRRAVPIRAILTTRVADGGPSRVRPASKSQALLVLGSSSLLQVPSYGSRRKGFDLIARLIERIPCYSLILGQDLPFVPRLVEEVVAQVPQP